MREIIKNQIKTHALENPEIECCGILFLDNSDKQLRIIKSINKAPDKTNRFEIDPKIYLKASLLGEILATYHSHINGEDFSEFDKFNSELCGIKYILYCIRSNKFKEYIPENYKGSYYGREFEFGKQDCFGLCRDYYKKELKIEITNYYRDCQWSEVDENPFEKFFGKEGFTKVLEGPLENDSQLKKHDVILTKFLGKRSVTHAGIYMGDGLVLHHPINCYSRVEPYDNDFMSQTVFVLRHKSLI
jgi:proteasome lid subunit RPN8/RPN11